MFLLIFMTELPLITLSSKLPYLDRLIVVAG